MTARILVIDDEAMVRALILRALQDDGYQVSAVGGGEEALDLAFGTRFDLVITNSWLRDMSGEEAIAKLRYSFPGIPILHIDDLPQSGEPFPVETKLNDIPVLHKPFSITALRTAVRGVIGKG